jgi:hypothetical protein
VGVNKLNRLHKHPRRAATRVVNTAPIWFEHLDEQFDNAARSVEFAAFLALGAGELGEEVFVNAAEHVLGAGFGITDLDVADQVNELAQACFVQRRAGVVLGQDARQRRVVALDSRHRVVHEPANGGLASLGFEVRPAGFGRNPEYVDGTVFVWVFRIGTFGTRRHEPGVVLLKSVGDVLEENQTEYDVLVFGGIHRAAEGIGGGP